MNRNKVMTPGLSILAWTLILCLLLGGSALAAGNGGMLLAANENGISGWANFLCEVEVRGRVYALDGYEQKIYEVNPNGSFRALTMAGADEQGAEGVPYRVPRWLLEKNGMLYALETTYCLRDGFYSVEGMGLYVLDVENQVTDRAVFEIKADGLMISSNGNEDSAPILGAAFCGETLVVGYELDAGNCFRVYDSGTGVFAESRLEGLSEVCAMDDARVLMICSDGNGQIIRNLDGKTMTLQDIVTLGTDARGFAYRDKALYYMREGALWKLESTKADAARRVAVCPSGMARGQLLSDGCYLAGSAQQLVRIAPDAELGDAQVTLVCAGNYYPGKAESWFLNHPDVVLGRGSQETGEDMITALLSQSDEVDVYFMTTNNMSPYRVLFNRGYLPALNSSVISELAASTYPAIQDALTPNGELAATPLGCVVQPMPAVNDALWTQIGGGERPETWQEFFEFMADDWPTLHAQHPEVSMFSDGAAAREALFYCVNNHYNGERMKLKEDPGYQNESFEGIMRVFERIDFSADSMNDSTAQQTLIRAEMDISPDCRNEGYTALPLVFQAGEAPGVLISLKVGFINPYSRHRAEALSLLEYLAQNVDAVDQICMCPNQNTAVRAENYESMLREFENEVNAVQAQLNTASDPAEIAELQDTLAYYNGEARTQMEADTWAATDEQIAAYRQAAQTVAVQYDETVSADDMNAVQAVMDSYLSGGCTLEQLIDQLQRMVSMRAAEE